MNFDEIHEYLLDDIEARLRETGYVAAVDRRKTAHVLTGYGTSVVPDDDPDDPTDDPPDEIHIEHYVEIDGRRVRLCATAELREVNKVGLVYDWFAS